MSVALPCERVFPIASLGSVFPVESHIQQAGSAQKSGMWFICLGVRPLTESSVLVTQPVRFVQSRKEERLQRAHKRFLRIPRSHLVLVRRLLLTSPPAECGFCDRAEAPRTREFKEMKFKVELDSTLSLLLREGRRLAGLCACQSFFLLWKAGNSAAW